MKSMLAASVVAGLCAATAAGGVPAQKHTPAGMRSAAASLLTLKDLGKGWSAQKPTSTSRLRLSCSGYQPSSKGIVEIGSAQSPNFSGGTTGPFIVQLTGVYANARQASALWARAVKPGLITCVTQSLATITSRGIKVAVSSQGRLPITTAGDRLAAYRVVATLSSSKQKLKTYFDVVLVQSGRTITEVTYSSLVNPVPANFEHAVALIFAHRSGTAGPAA